MTLQVQSFNIISCTPEYIVAVQQWCLENIGPRHTIEQAGLWRDKEDPEWAGQRYQIMFKNPEHAAMFQSKWVK